MSKHNDLGKQGEQAAVDYLKTKGYKILETNWRYEKSEIDIIAKYKEEIIFVEVKTRSSKNFGYPEEAVDNKKQNQISNAAGNFLRENKLKQSVRFDIISLNTTSNHQFEIYHIEDAFYPFYFY